MEIEQHNEPEPEDISPDRSVLKFALIMGGIVLSLALLSIYLEDIRRLFNPPPTPQVVSEQVNAVELVDESASMSDEDIRKSLTKFIEAFFVDQKKGYFDPPSYFTPITQTYYNYHHLTFQRLKQVHWARMADMKDFNLVWLVHTLNFEHQQDSLSANFWTKQNYFRPSKNTRESADVLLEMVITKEGKIAVLRELEVRNKTSIPMGEAPTEGNVPALPVPATAPVNTEIKPKESADATIHNSGLLDYPPDFPGGNKKLSRYLNREIRYPKQARDQKVAGKVFVSFVVEASGSLSNLKVIRGIGAGCDEEALRVLRNSPAWKPGMLDGKAVRSTFVLPVNFQLVD
jgi:TonB family protein